MIDKQVVARLSSHGHNFEILVHSDKAQLFRGGKISDVRDVLITDGIFKKIRTVKTRDKVLMMDDAKSTERIDDSTLLDVFGTADVLKVSEQILQKGEIQHTTEQRHEMLEQKRRKIIDLIVKGGIDPRTNAPHTPQRVESAMEEAKVNVELHKPAEAQVKGIVSKIMPFLPIKIEKKKILLKIPVNVAGRARTIVVGSCTILKENWIGDKWNVTAEVPAGLQEKLFSQLNNLTHGELESENVG